LYSPRPAAPVSIGLFISDGGVSLVITHVASAH
jgi:hypothetical protein